MEKRRHYKMEPVFASKHALLLLTAMMVMAFPAAVMSICPPRCNCDDETLVVQCERANLDVVPIMLNPGVRELSLRHNNIRAVIAAFAFYKDLEWLDLSHNRLSALETGCFEAQRRLRVLHLSRNQLVTVLNSTFTGLQSLRVLRLDSNHMAKVEERAFAPLVALQELDLSDNELQSIHAQAFVGLDSLGKLSLARNRLTAVPSLSPPLPKVHHLVLDGNPFYALPSTEAFETFPALLHLSLDSCRLSSLSAQALNGPEALRSLRLRDNALTAVPSKTLWANLQHLEELDIGANAFEIIPSNAFEGLTSLQRLQVTDCPHLLSILPEAFANLPSLTTLVIRRNPKLTTLEPRSLDGMPSLRHISLKSNSISSMPQGILSSYLPQLESLDLQENPLNCNCSLAWLKGWLLDSSNGSSEWSNLSHVTCRTPEQLNEKLLKEVTDDELGCFLPSATEQAVFGIAGAAGAVCLVTLVFLVYKFRRRVTRALKVRWTEGGLRSKDVHYEKTNDDEQNEENTILQAAHQSLKMTPVTEL